MSILGSNHELDMLQIKELNPAWSPPLPAVIKESGPPDNNRKEHEKRANKKDEPAGCKQSKQGCERRLGDHDPVGFLLRPMLSAALMMQAVNRFPLLPLFIERLEPKLKGFFLGLKFLYSSGP